MTPESPQHPQPLYIDGQWAAGRGLPLTSVNPATGRINHVVTTASAEDVDHAVQAAQRAARQPAWRDMLPHARARVLGAIADAMERRTDEFVRAQMLENGKVLAECRNQVASAVATFRYYAAVCETQGSELTPARGNYVSMAVHEPYGVVAAITPWNSPMTMEAQKVAPALAAGNAVVLKPSEVTPTPALVLARAAHDAGLAPGLLNVLPGTGQVTGDAIVRHPGVSMVTFTGGTESGRRIAGLAAGKLMPVALELGGKSPHIVFEDADLRAAVAGVAGGIFEGSGQSCVAGSRLFVQRSIHDRFLSELKAVAEGLRVGLPDVTGSQMGPIATFAHRDRIAGMVAEALEAGGRLVTGGRRPENPQLAEGAFFLPTLIAGLPNSASICQQEVFGPVLVVLPFDDEDDLVAQANDSAFGLAAGIWTANIARAWRIARRLDAGTVWINTYKQLSIATPFGGFKDSGLGREKGIGGMRLYQQTKAIYLGLS